MVRQQAERKLLRGYRSIGIAILGTLALLLAGCATQGTGRNEATTTAVAQGMLAAQSEEATSTVEARASATAQMVVATLTAEARITPTPDIEVADVARHNFEQWAQANGEPFRDVQVAVTENDGFFAAMQVIAWFRPQREAPWEEREATVECRKVGAAWQCDGELFAFDLTQGEEERRVQATATVVAAAQATVEALMPAALQDLSDRFGMTFVLVPAGEFSMGSTEAEVDAALELCNQTQGNCQREWF